MESKALSGITPLHTEATRHCSDPQYSDANASMQPNMISHLDAILNGRNRRIGEDTIKTRNAKITSVMNEYVVDSPLTRF